MIDFDKAGTIKLHPVALNTFDDRITPIFVQNEKSIAAFQSIRDGIIFTNFRIIAVNVQGLTGKKIDITSMPYKKIQVFSVETAGTFDLDTELELWFSGVGKLKFEFSRGTNVSQLCQLISSYVL